jgi:hypothetical protein
MVVFLGLLVALVFGVTFASMYVRQTPTTPTNKGEGGSPALSLTFPRQVYPMRDPKYPPELVEAALVSEFREGAYFDFWFRNDNDEEVRVGLNRKNCDCFDVKLFVAPDGWRKQLAATVWDPKKGSGLMTNIVLPVVVAAGMDSKTWPDLGEKEGVAVPPRAIGFVRLLWERRRGTAGIQGQPLTAALWTGSPGRVSASLSVGVLLVDPVHVDTNTVNLEPLGSGDSSTATLRCWSSSRPRFDLAVRSADNPLIVAHKEPLTEADVEDLERSELLSATKQRRPPRPVLSGWRITVTAQERSKDGKHQLDSGPFTHPLILVPANIRMEQIEVAVQGLVRGDIEVVGGASIRLGAFDTRSGTRREVKLTADRRELNLKLVKHPPFMKVSLEKEKPGAWQLTVAIEPNKVSGAFPRRDNEAYRDTAIYLAIEGEGGRRMRIPVSGNGLQ